MRAKSRLKLLLHKLLGLEKFLFYFSIFKIKTLKFDKNEKDIYGFINIINRSNKEGIILDIGANIGITTGILALNTNRNIHSYEPIKLNFNILIKIVQFLNINNKVIGYNIALGNEKGYCDMVFPLVDNVKMHGLCHIIDPSIKEFNEGEIIDKILIDKLDNIYSDEKIAGIKIDVENYEYIVLKGGVKLLQNQKPIIYIELWDNENRINCFNYLRNLGYKSYYFKNKKLIPFENNVLLKQTFVFM